MAGRKKSDKPDILKRQLDAVEMRKQGMSYRAIADRLEVSFQQVQRDVTEELKRLAALNLNAADELRQLELERLDRIIAGMDHWVQAGNAQAAMATLKAMDTRAKLLGLYAPEKVQAITWQDEIINLLRTGQITPEQVKAEIGNELAKDLFIAVGLPILTE